MLEPLGENITFIFNLTNDKLCYTLFTGSIVINQSLSVSKQTKTKSINSMKGKKTKITLKKELQSLEVKKKMEVIFLTLKHLHSTYYPQKYRIINC